MRKTKIINKIKDNIKKYKIKKPNDLNLGPQKDYKAIKSDWEAIVGKF